MIEKMPPFERPEPVVVGPASPEKKQEYKRMIVERFREGHYERIPEDKRKILESLEYEKKPYEREAIKQANEVTNTFIEEFGLTPFDVPERNIYIFPETVYQQIEKDRKKFAVTFQDQQLIVMNAERLIDPIVRTSTILHEITHLKNFLSIEAYEDLYQLRRIGLQILASRKKAERIGFFTAFSGLDEAVVSEIEKRYLPEIIRQNKFLANDYQRETSEEVLILKGGIALKEGRSVDEIMQVSRDGKVYALFPYYEQRKVLYYIVEKIYKDNRERFNSLDDVMKLFFRSHFDGRLLDIARLIENSFGKDAFKMVGTMDTNVNSANLVMDYLTKKRRKK